LITRELTVSRNTSIFCNINARIHFLSLFRSNWSLLIDITLSWCSTNSVTLSWTLYSILSRCQTNLSCLTMSLFWSTISESTTLISPTSLFLKILMTLLSYDFSSHWSTCYSYWSSLFIHSSATSSRSTCYALLSIYLVFILWFWIIRIRQNIFNLIHIWTALHSIFFWRW
jgi:hypothetical protein